MRDKYKEKKIEVQDLKIGLSCQKCGYNKCGAALEFHHINPEEKLFSLRSINESKYTKQELLTEFNRTCLVCGNCHRKLHNGLLNNVHLK